jgi:hypothetical protein
MARWDRHESKWPRSCPPPPNWNAAISSTLAGPTPFRGDQQRRRGLVSGSGLHREAGSRTWTTPPWCRRRAGPTCWRLQTPARARRTAVVVAPPRLLARGRAAAHGDGACRCGTAAHGWTTREQLERLLRPPAVGTTDVPGHRADQQAELAVHTVSTARCGGSVAQGSPMWLPHARTGDERRRAAGCPSCVPVPGRFPASRARFQPIGPAAGASPGRPPLPPRPQATKPGARYGACMCQRVCATCQRGRRDLPGHDARSTSYAHSIDCESAQMSWIDARHDPIVQQLGVGTGSEWALTRSRRLLHWPRQLHMFQCIELMGHLRRGRDK